MIVKLLKLVFLVPIGFFFVFVLRMLDKVGVRVRFGEFISNRLGHLAGNTECYLNEKSAGLQSGFDIWAHNGPVASPQLAKMIARKVCIDPTGFSRLVSLCNSTITGWEKHFANSSQMDRDIYNLMERFPPNVSFTFKELAKGEAGLVSIGITPGSKWVCLNVRDSAFHPALSYHSYRDADIKNYAPAAKWLADKGYYVVRMGAKVHHPMPIKHPRIIDFALKSEDFMSVYLGAFCHFTISTSSGWDGIPYIFRRPIVYTDFVPVEYLFTFLKGSLAIWKHHEKEGKRMTFKEIIESNAGKFMRADQFKEAGITLVDNTPEEILTVVQEMESGVHGPDEDQKKFWKDFPLSISEYNNTPLHGAIKMRIGSEFLKGYM